ncbi:MAG: YHS domain-containing protein [Byssovorax sp.]
MRVLFFALTLASSLALAACGGASGNASGAATAGASDFKPIGEAKVGDKTHCPVSGEDFTVAADSPKVELDGKTYYFCCPGCAKKFQADPQKFLKKPAT